MRDASSLASDQATSPSAPDDRYPAAALPPPPTLFVGRQLEIDDLAARLDDPTVRLLTLTGPGGVGKTRLAIEVARRLEGDYADGVVYVELASIRDPYHVLPAVARALATPIHAGRALFDSLIEATRDRHLLLMLDNVEHLLEVPPSWLPDLLEACPRVKVLATSRAALRVGAEHRYAVPPLPVDATDREDVAEGVAEDEAAVRLFAQRAAAVRPGFTVDASNREIVREICRRLDGLPLAIELAAARLNILTPASLLARLTDRFALLTGGQRGTPARLRSLHDTIAWSYDLLAAEDQRLFRQLSVFVGGFSLDAAEAACGGDGIDVLAGIASLDDQSLVRPVSGPDGDARFEMLETIQEFAAARLTASGEEAAMRDRHATWFLTRVRGDVSVFDPFTDDGDLGRLAVDHGNLRAALDWLDASGRHADLATLVNRLRWFWYIGAHFAEGGAWHDRVLLHTGARDPLLQCDLLTGAAFLAHYRFEGLERARACLADALVIARDVGDPRREADATFYLATMDEDAGCFEAAAEGLRRARALYGAASDPWGQLGCDYHLGIVTYGLGDRTAAERMIRTAEIEAERMGDRFTPSWCRDYLILFACDARDAGRAVALLRRQRDDLAAKSSQRPEFLVALAGAVATVRGRDALAARLFGAHAALVQDVPLHDPERETIARFTALVRAHLGRDQFDVAWAEGRRLRAPEIAAAIDAVLDPEGDARSPAGRGAATHHDLTARELEVLRLMAAGITNREIADALFVTRRTVNTHIEHILAKLKVRSRTAAVAFAVRNGLA